MDPHAPADLTQSSRPTGSSRLTLFASLWALAALFHVWVDPRGAGFIANPSWTGASHVAVAAVAVALLLRPRSVPLLLGLCGVELWSLWMELPVAGNHWVLVGLVDVGILLAAATGSVGRALPVARWTVLAFYAFAAFAKLNSAFLDPDVSCGSFFLSESADSWDFGAVAGEAAGRSALGWAAVWGTLLTELSIPVLLLVRRTRVIGVVVGLAFHGVIALDRTHAFADFSAALTALFVLFLPPSFEEWLRERVDRRNRLVLTGGGAVVATVLTLLRLAEPTSRVHQVLNDGRLVAWVAVIVVILGSVVAYLRATRPRPDAPGPMVMRPGWLVVVPALAIANGLTPYLELKTAFGWNMYSNLVTVDGHTNHLILPRTLPLTDAHEDLVRILDTSDPGLRLYVQRGYDLPWRAFRGYLSDHPDVAIRYQRDGEVHDLARAADDPNLVRPPSLLEEKLLVFRAVDQQDPPRCQPSFLPAH